MVANGADNADLSHRSAKLVVLGGLTGREFFDAAIPLEKIEAVLVRTKQ